MFSLGVARAGRQATGGGHLGSRASQRSTCTRSNSSANSPFHRLSSTWRSYLIPQGSTATLTFWESNACLVFSALSSHLGSKRNSFLMVGRIWRVMRRVHNWPCRPDCRPCHSASYTFSARRNSPLASTASVPRMTRPEHWKHSRQAGTWCKARVAAVREWLLRWVAVRPAGSRPSGWNKGRAGNAPKHHHCHLDCRPPWRQCSWQCNRCPRPPASLQPRCRVQGAGS